LTYTTVGGKFAEKGKKSGSCLLGRSRRKREREKQGKITEGGSNDKKEGPITKSD